MTPGLARSAALWFAFYVVLVLVIFAGVAHAQSTTPAPGQAAPSVVLVCGPATASSPGTNLCPDDVNGNPQAPSTVQGYVLSSADYSALEAASAPFDATFAAACFVYGIGAVFAAYFLALPAGILVRLVQASR